MKKRIAIFIGGYLPAQKYGGPVTSISNFVELLGDHYEVRIICSNHDFKETTPFLNISSGWNRVGKADVLYLKDEQQNYRTYLSVLNEIKPDLIYGSGIMYIRVNYQVFQAARQVNIPILLAPRGDICDNALQIKKWKKKPFLAIMKLLGVFKGLYFHATIQEEVENLKKYLGVSQKNIFLLPNLPASPVHRDGYVKVSGTIKIVFLSRIQEKKNLLDAIKIVNKMKAHVQFDIYGPLENYEYFSECQAEMVKAPKNVKIEYKGALPPKEAKMIFSQYDCFLFPTLSENYGHVIAEALMHDCPIVISKGTTPWDDINDYNAGAAVELDNNEGFVLELENIASLDNKAYWAIINNVRRYVEVKMSINDLKNNYIKMIESII